METGGITSDLRAAASNTDMEEVRRCVMNTELRGRPLAVLGIQTKEGVHDNGLLSSRKTTEGSPLQGTEGSQRGFFPVQSATGVPGSWRRKTHTNAVMGVGGQQPRKHDPRATGTAETAGRVAEEGRRASRRGTCLCSSCDPGLVGS